MKLSDFDIQVLKEITKFKKNDGWMAPREVELKFSDDDDYEEAVKKSTLELLSLKYIKGCGSPDPDGSHGAYSITPQGKQYLEELSYKPLFGTITNSNVAINSSEIIQTLKIGDPEIKQKIKELEIAIKEKNPSKIKKAFGYIADKAVDVAIQILLRGIIPC